MAAPFLRAPRPTGAASGTCPNGGNRPCGGGTDYDCCGLNCCIRSAGYCADPTSDLCCLNGQGICFGPNGPACTNGGPAEYLDGNCRCQPCDGGRQICQNRCVLPCAADQLLNQTTCACECVGATCGDTCCPLGSVCIGPATSGDAARCCPADKVCAAICAGDPGLRCCRAGANGFACPTGTTCCPRPGGGGCCRQGKETCAHGRCVKKKKGKH